jgi:hypothetical protein
VNLGGRGNLVPSFIAAHLDAKDVGGATKQELLSGRLHNPCQIGELRLVLHTNRPTRR